MKVFKPFVSAKAKKYVMEVLDSDQLAEGPFVKKFEEAFAKKFGFMASNVVTLNSGTSALELAYELAGIGQGDEVITPVLTCTATNLPLIHRGAKIVFADVNEDLVLHPADVLRKITSKTKAIIYVHFGGYGEGLRAIQKIASSKGIIVIEDAAQSVGAKKGWGTSEFACVSLQAIKTLTSGDGGILICRDRKLAGRAKQLRWFGYDRAEKQTKREIDLYVAGYKYHMNDISAAIGLGNLESLGSLLWQRRKVQKWYRESSVSPFLLIRHWLVIFKHKTAKKVEKALEKEGIYVAGYHYRNDALSVFGGSRQELPIMNRLEGNYTTLPFHHGLTEEDVEKVVNVIENVMEEEYGRNY